MALKFKHNGSLKSGLKSGRENKSVNVTGMESVSTALKERFSIGAEMSGNVLPISSTLDLTVSTVHIVLRKSMQYHPYKITHTQEMLAAYLPKRENFSR